MTKEYYICALLLIAIKWLQGTGFVREKGDVRAGRL